MSYKIQDLITKQEESKGITRRDSVSLFTRLRDKVYFPLHNTLRKPPSLSFCPVLLSLFSLSPVLLLSLVLPPLRFTLTLSIRFLPSSLPLFPYLSSSVSSPFLPLLLRSFHSLTRLCGLLSTL